MGGIPDELLEDFSYSNPVSYSPTHLDQYPAQPLSQHENVIWVGREPGAGWARLNRRRGVRRSARTHHTDEQESGYDANTEN